MKSISKGRATKPTGLPPSRSLLSNWPLVMAVLGTALLAAATLLQLTKMQESAQTKTRLQRSQLVVDLFEIGRDQWQIALDQELSRERPDPHAVTVFAEQTAVTLARWKAVLKQRVSDDESEYQSAISERDQVISTAKNLANRQDVKGLLQLVASLSAEGRNLQASDDRFSEIVSDAEVRDARLSTWTVTLYVLGSALAIVSSVATAIQSSKTLDRIEVRLS